MNLKQYDCILELVKSALWQPSKLTVDETIYNELSRHAITTLVAPVLSSLEMSAELREKWKVTIIHQIANYSNYKHVQSNLPITVPYVILKGTSASQYYDHPEFRACGDIDIMPAREDIQTVCAQLIEGGYRECNTHEMYEFGRHRVFFKNGILIEVHAFYALLNDKQKAEYLDDLIFANINASHVLPDMINGLVILEHINQHLETGIGLRQIIDWMMFVEKCLSDEKWDDFCSLAHNSGLETLAVVVTRMCEKYLGLPARNWCNAANDELCEQLMEYVLESGNFGKNKKDENHTGALILSFHKSPMAAFSLLQRRGLINWKSVKKHHWLRPFAWLYQLIRYITKGIGRDHSISKLKQEYELSRERDQLFSALGVKQTSKGLAVLENGEYVKTYKIP